MNQGKLPERKIQIRPIETIPPQNKDEQTEIHHTEMKTAIEQMESELTALKERKKTELEDMQARIEEEKLDWQTEKKKWIDEAQQTGYRSGYEEGKQDGKAEYQELLNEANRIVDLVKVDYQKTLEQTEGVVIELAIHTAEKILDRSIEEQPEDFIRIVKAALKEIKDQSVISIYLHPKNYKTVLQQKAELKRIIESDTKLSLYINEELEEDSCVIVHPFGEIDASVDTQLGEIRNALKELVMEQD
jgi:flagellar assembly protein FliH